VQQLPTHPLRMHITGAQRRLLLSPLRHLRPWRLLLGTLVVAEPSIGPEKREGNAVCWDGNFNYHRCCVVQMPECWDDLHDYDACCLEATSHIPIPRACYMAVTSHMIIHGFEITGLEERPQLSALLFNHGQMAMDNIAWALPEEGQSTAPVEAMDIGVGLGAVGVFVHRHYGGRVRFMYVDRSEHDPEGMAPISTGEQPGYGSTHPFYGNLGCTKELSRLSGLADVTLLNLEQDASGLASLESDSADLVYSIASWGYHYPVALHLKEVVRILRPDGVLIITLRSGEPASEGLSALYDAGFTCTSRKWVELKGDTTRCTRELSRFHQPL